LHVQTYSMPDYNITPTELIGRKIRTRRVELGYSQTFLSTRLALTQNAISNLENGKSGISVERLVQIAKLLKTDLNYFTEENQINEKDVKISDLETLVKRLEKRNEILELYILKYVHGENRQQDEQA
jgi:transcriptional regulator with XRE-family HTH domain